LARPLSQARRWRRLAPILPLLLLAACGGRPLPGAKPPPPGWVALAQNQPLMPRSMAPPPPPARPPSPGSTDFGHWQQEGNYFKWTPGQHLGPTPGPIWVPGHWANDASGNKVWSPGYWR
jgi:hypothetical protein